MVNDRISSDREEMATRLVMQVYIGIGIRSSARFPNPPALIPVLHFAGAFLGSACAVKLMDVAILLL